MPGQTRDGFVEGRVVLAETKSREMTGPAFLIKGADGHGGHPRLHRDVAAEILIVAVEAKRPEVGVQKISAATIRGLEAHLR